MSHVTSPQQLRHIVDSSEIRQMKCQTITDNDYLDITIRLQTNEAIFNEIRLIDRYP